MKKKKQAASQGRVRYTWLIGLAILLALLGGYLWMTYSQGTTEGEPTLQAQNEPQTAVTSVSELVKEEVVELTNFPTVRTVELPEGRYQISFESDKKIKLVLYSQERYNEWQNTGEHTISKLSTQEGVECCAASGSYTVDINEGEAGTYYFIFEDPRNLGATSSSLEINKIGELGR